MQLQRAYELLILDRRMSSSKDRNSDKPALTTFLPAQRLLRQIVCHVKAVILAALLSLLATLASAAGLPPLPSTPMPVTDLVFARPFTLAQGYKYDWSKDGPIVTSGTLVVLKVNPDLVVPRNTAEPVLYAGSQSVQRLNDGHESGHVIAIIPGEIDLTKSPIWFGRPGLPERVTAQTIRTERALADAAKIQPFAAEKVHSVTKERLQVSDLSSLLRDYVADLVLAFSPQEKSLADTWRLPVAKALPVPK
jgi:hypothetical protein